MKKKSSLPAHIERFISYSQDASRKLLEIHSQGFKFESDHLTQDSRVLGHWMGMVLISAREVKLTFKVHFMTRNAKALAASTYGLPAEQISMDQALDFMREFCNLMAGSYKQALSKIEVDSGISLPLLTRGFDQVFFNPQSVPNQHHWNWALHSSFIEVHCSITMEDLKGINLQEFPKECELKVGDHGNAEFL